ncbi:MAG: alpha/beta hydrolase [Phycisphaeraceae bacterium]|nr:alpha/beta hydrolase [Phycisphaeraceae bacterium]
MTIRTIPVELPRAHSAEIYRTVDDIDLPIHLFKPQDVTGPTPAVVFYFGGGWTGGSIQQFYMQACYLAQRGVTCGLVEYRIKNKHNVTPFACVEDARSAMRYIKLHADRLGIDSQRICASGGSAGGHLAANTATAKNCDAPDDDLAIDPTPAAMFLFNPVLDTVASSWAKHTHNESVSGLLKDFGDRGSDVSPMHNVESGLPPTMIVHGEDDVTVPYQQVIAFTQLMLEAGNDCQLIGYPQQGHGFFNYREGNNTEIFTDTLTRLDDFLVSLGWLAPGQFVESFDASLS